MALKVMVVKGGIKGAGEGSTYQHIIQNAWI